MSDNSIINCPHKANCNCEIMIDMCEHVTSIARNKRVGTNRNITDEEIREFKKPCNKYCKEVKEL